MAAAIPFIVAAASVGGAVSSIVAATKKAPEVSAPPPPIQNNATAAPETVAPEPAVETAVVKAKAETERRKRAISRSQTIYTSPLGIAGQAAVSRKTLLGQ